MKRITILLFAVLFVLTSVVAQVAINTDGSQPDNSAILDLQSTSGGLLLPRMNTMQQRYISNPIAGLLIYNTDSSDFYGFNGNKWVSIYDNTDSITEWSCGSPITDTRDGQLYETAQYGTMCWMAENLNIGTKITSTPTNNDIIEKFCYQNNDAYCDIYGGLYYWDELMQYSTTENVQGICPDGWFIPSDSAWKVLEGIVDSNYDVGHYIWDQLGWRGTNAGGVLKEAGYTHWKYPNAGAVNGGGFTALPGGLKNTGGGFSYLTYEAEFWTSTDVNAAYSFWRAINYNDTRIYRNSLVKYNAMSIRCLKE